MHPTPALETGSSRRVPGLPGAPFSGSTLRHWARAALIAMGLNLLLFGAMPYLISPKKLEPALEVFQPQIQVVRVQRLETSAARKTLKPPEPPPEKKMEKPVVAPQQNFTARLTLPFEVNPQLPGGPMTLELPPFAPSTAEQYAFKIEPGMGAPGPEIFAAGQLDKPLTVLNRIAPIYPARAKSRGIEGSVKVRLLVGTDGKVEEVHILDARPAGFFEASVRQSARRWRFEAGTVNGSAVRAWVETTIRFELGS